MNVGEVEEFAMYTPKVPCSEVQWPDGIGNYRPHLTDDTHVIGIGESSPLFCSDTSYLFRPPPGATYAKPRCTAPGEIGWGIPWLVDWTPPRTGQQIVLGDFRQLAEDKKTHEFIGAWFPGPKEMDPTIPRSAKSGTFRNSPFASQAPKYNCRSLESDDTSSNRVNMNEHANWASTDFRYPEIDSLRMRTFESTKPRIFQKYC